MTYWAIDCTNHNLHTTHPNKSEAKITFSAHIRTKNCMEIEMKKIDSFEADDRKRKGWQ